MDWYPFYPTEFKADTLDFTLAEDGAYRRLIDHYMETRQPLPASEAALARIIGVSINDFQAIAERVLSKFSKDGEVLRHRRCEIELDRQDNMSKKRSEAAKRAAAKRHKNKVLQASAEQVLSKRLPQDKTGQDSIEIGKPISCEFDDAVSLFNELAEKTKIPRVQKLSSARKSALKKRLGEAGGLDGWRVALEKVAGSAFLRGDKTNWHASFDWLTKAGNFTKVMEGNYDNDDAPKSGGQADAINKALNDMAQNLMNGGKL